MTIPFWILVFATVAPYALFGFAAPQRIKPFGHLELLDPVTLVRVSDWFDAVAVLAGQSKGQQIRRIRDQHLTAVHKRRLRQQRWTPFGSSSVKRRPFESWPVRPNGSAA